MCKTSCTIWEKGIIITDMPTNIRDFIEREYYSPGAYWEGNEYWTLNPNRMDSSIGSFSIREDGVWHDFATGESGKIRPDNIVDFVHEHKEYFELHEVEKIKGDLVTPYYDPEADKISFVVVRFDGEGKKVVYPLSKKSGKWTRGLQDWQKSRPLLPLQDHSWPTLIVEGEKCYIKALQFMRVNGIKMNVTTWHGGTGSVKKIDYAYLYRGENSNVMLWPDNDTVGQNAMQEIALQIIDKKHVCFVPPIPGKPNGWDIADAIAEMKSQEIITIMKNATKQLFTEKKDLIEFINAINVKEEEEPKQDKDYPLTDLGNGERFADMWKDICKYNVDRGKWVIWNGAVWEENPARLSALVKQTIEKCYDVHHDKAIALESYNRIKNMLTLASVQEGVIVKETDFDTDPYTVVVRNGVIDLRTGALLPHSKHRLVSKMIDVEYKPESKRPVFDVFLKEITCERPDIEEFLQRWFGVCLSGDTSPQLFAIFYGPGANGKSTLVETVQKILGPYGAVAPADTLIDKKYGSGIPNDLAGMRGARAMFAAETESGARLAESKIKSMTGGEVISARFMRGEYFSFKPAWKITLSTNHKPRIVNSDVGIWRRIALVPFDYIVPEHKRDPNLMLKLEEELEGILAWMVQGAVKYFNDGAGRGGLKVPQVIIDEVKDYKEEEDIFAWFVDDTCYTEEYMKSHGLPDRIKGNVLHKIFLQWATQTNNMFYTKISLQKFYSLIKDRGYKIQSMDHNYRYVMGIYPKEEYLAKETD